jgi:hypothetical protein
MNLPGSLFRWFGLLRIELIGQKGCREFDTFLENALILHEMLA